MTRHAWHDATLEVRLDMDTPKLAGATLFLDNSLGVKVDLLSEQPEFRWRVISVAFTSATRPSRHGAQRSGAILFMYPLLLRSHNYGFNLCLLCFQSALNS